MADTDNNDKNGDAEKPVVPSAQGSGLQTEQPHQA
jgi:hypothetical protein